jgi:hypothetical protein
VVFTKVAARTRPDGCVRVAVIQQRLPPGVRLQAAADIAATTPFYVAKSFTRLG